MKRTIPPSGQPQASAGLTLVELLIGAAITSLVILAAARVLLAHINVINRSVWSAEAQRNFTKLSYLLKTEVSEGCTLRANGASLAETAASCIPPATSPCNGAVGTEFTVLVPIFNPGMGEPSYRKIRYFTSGTTLLRSGPRILTSGRLDPSTTQDDVVVLDNVTAFRPTVSTDCRSVAVELELPPPNTAVDVARDTRTTTLRTGVQNFIQ